MRVLSGDMNMSCSFLFVHEEKGRDGNPFW